MRIKHILLASTVLVSVAAFAQKEELKGLKKIYAKEEIKGNDFAEYKALISKAEPLATEESDKVYVKFYKVMTPLLQVMTYGQNVTPTQIATTITPQTVKDLAAGLLETLEYEKKVGKKVYTDDINETIVSFKSQLYEVARGYLVGKRFKDATDIFYALYQLDKKDNESLYNAASCAINIPDYDRALEYYIELKRLNYTGEATMYFAVNKISKIEDYFGVSPVQRDLMVKTGQYEKPREEMIPSKRNEVYKNIALILVSKDKIEEAKTAVAEARKENPNDDSLILTEADLYLKLKDFDNYTKLVNEALAKDPNNVDLVYNLGVISANANKLEDAEKYYVRALEINPNYFNANLNLAELIIRADEKFVAEMNKLGTSEKENKRYEVLKGQREKNFKKALPYLEKAVELKPEDDPAKKTLLTVYNALEMTDKYKALKAKH